MILNSKLSGSVALLAFSLRSVLAQPRLAHLAQREKLETERLKARKVQIAEVQNAVSLSHSYIQQKRYHEAEASAEKALETLNANKRISVPNKIRLEAQDHLKQAQNVLKEVEDIILRADNKARLLGVHCDLLLHHSSIHPFGGLGLSGASVALQEAVDLFSGAVLMYPHPQIHIALSRCFIHLKRYDEAQTSAEQAIKMLNSSQRYNHFEILIFNRAGTDPIEQSERLHKAAQTARDGCPHLQEGESHFRKGEFVDASTCYLNAINVYRSCLGFCLIIEDVLPNVYAQLLLVKEKQFEKACAELQRVVDDQSTPTQEIEKAKKSVAVAITNWFEQCVNAIADSADKYQRRRAIRKFEATYFIITKKRESLELDHSHFDNTVDVPEQPLTQVYDQQSKINHCWAHASATVFAAHFLSWFPGFGLRFLFPWLCQTGDNCDQQLHDILYRLAYNHGRGGDLATFAERVGRILGMLMLMFGQNDQHQKVGGAWLNLKLHRPTFQSGGWLRRCEVEWKDDGARIQGRCNGELRDPPYPVVLEETYSDGADHTMTLLDADGTVLNSYGPDHGPEYLGEKNRFRNQSSRSKAGHIQITNTMRVSSHDKEHTITRRQLSWLEYPDEL